MNNRILRIAIFLLLFAASCHKRILPEAGSYQYAQKGKASYYADKFDGKQTASGETFYNNKLTAAHRTLPFGTIVKVTNLQNNKYVVVKINDRGPFAPGRIIDLSKGAAKKIDMLAAGVVEVTVQYNKK